MIAKNMELDLTFSSKFTYEECCERLENWSDWAWKRGDSEALGQHLKGKNQQSELIELYYLDEFRLDLVAASQERLLQLQREILQLLQGTVIVFPQST